MPLSCSCNFESEPGSYICYPGEDFETLRTSKRKRCRSCKELINLGSFVVKCEMTQVPDHEIDINIYGEDGEIARAPRYLCEKCGEIYLNLFAVGFECVWIEEDMRELLKQYQEVYNPPKLNV